MGHRPEKKIHRAVRLKEGREGALSTLQQRHNGVVPVPRVRSTCPGLPWGVSGLEDDERSPRSFLLIRSASQPPSQVFAQVITKESESVVAYRIFYRFSASKSRRMSQEDNHPLLLGKQISFTIG